jgi:hypothetical protein
VIERPAVVLSGLRRREAEAWFFSDDSRWLFSFVPVCAALGLEAGYIRKKLGHG